MSERRDSSLLQLTLVRVREFLREPEMLFWTFGFPILLAGGLGIAFRNQPADVVHVAVVRNGAASAQVETWLRADKAVQFVPMAEDKANLALRTGSVSLAVVPRADGGLTWRYDDSNPEGRAARLIVENAVERGAGRRDLVATSEDRDREPGSRYIDFLLPALLGTAMMGDGMWGIGFSIVDSRRRNLLKRLIASPMSKVQFLLSYLLSRIVILTTEIAVISFFGWLAFGVPFRGPFLLFVAICLLGGLTFNALGVLLSTRVQTIEAISGLMNLAMMPMWVLSGVFFSSSRFPAFLQPVIHALPLTAAIDALRANMLQGGGVMAVRAQLATLAVWLVVSFFTALRLFRWR